MYTTKEEENNTMTKRQQEKLDAIFTCTFVNDVRPKMLF